MSNLHVQPRRRPARGTGDDVTPPGLPHLNARQYDCPPHDMLLRKGATFHAPSSPSSSVSDPRLNIHSLPRRSPTSPQALEDLVIASEQRMAGILAVFDRSKPDNHTDEDCVLPVPCFFLAHARSDAVMMDVDGPASPSAEKLNSLGKFSKLITTAVNHHHTSDSGIGTSISSASACWRPSTRQRAVQGGLCMGEIQRLLANASRDNNDKSTTSVYSAVAHKHSAINESFTSNSTPKGGHYLSDYAVKQIQKHIIRPILAERTLKEYHPLVEDIPHRIGDRAITCLRDLEKTLIFLAPVSTDFAAGEEALAYCYLRMKSRSKSAAAYLTFCETSIQCIHTTVEHLNEVDQRRPKDRPYTNNYFLDLVQQVQQYARIMAATRQREAQGKQLTDMDYSASVPDPAYDSFFESLLTYGSDERLSLQGGISQGGRPAELFREKDGKMIAIDAGRDAVRSDCPDVDLYVDEGAERSMGRKRKCDIGKVEWRACRECGKEFTRPCDLTKHEKTHSRPWKCSHTDCKYHTLGWPTEKERDRHANDKHSSEPPLYKCLFKCPYTSKRESNCKQHMEKAHGWQYVRSKSKKSQSLVPSKITPPTSTLPTPSSGSAFPALSAPSTPQLFSPPGGSNGAWSPTDSTHDSPASYQISPVNALRSRLNPSVSPDGFLAAADHNFSSGSFDIAKQYGAPYSPDLSDGRHHSLNMSGTGNTHSVLNSARPSAFEQDFDFNNFGFANASQPVIDIFPQYHNEYENVQQPTPAWSDQNDAFSVVCPDFWSGVPDASASLHLTPVGQGSVMLGAVTPRFPTFDDEGFGDEDGHGLVKQDDFTLFDNTALGPIGGESSSMDISSMFPELGTVGEQFGDDPIYDAMAESLDRYTTFE